MKNIAIILTSGTGQRSGLNVPKQFIKIAGKTVFEHTIDVFEKNTNIDEIIVVAHSNYIDYIEEIIKKNKYAKIKKVLSGGQTRRESSKIGITSIEYENARVLIHDAVRPFLYSEIIDDCINALKTYKAVDVAIDSADTLIKINDKNIITDIPDRNLFKRGQTPQGFDLKTIKKAHELADQDKDINVTDDCALVLKFGLSDIYVVKGNNFNHKITYPIDVAVADKLFQIKSINSINKDLTGLSGKIIAVFGATKGIGAAVKTLAEKNNAKVYGFSRSTNTNIKSLTDVEAALKDIYIKEHKIDYIVNTAGILNMGVINTRKYNEIIEEIQINYLGCINIALASYKYLKETKGNLIFYTSSSYTRGRALYSIYSSTKAAVVNLTQAIAEEWENDNIRVNVINPERTATPMRYANFGKEPEETLLSAQKVAEETLKALLSDYTGQVIDVRKVSY